MPNQTNTHETCECPACDETGVHFTMEELSFPYGTAPNTVNLKILAKIGKCNACGFAFQHNSTETAKVNAICEHLNRFCPAEVKSIRNQTNLSQDDFAKLSGFGAASIRRWETGALIQSESADNLLLLLTHPENAEILRRKQTQLKQELALKDRFKSIDPDQHQLAAENFQLHQ